MLVSIIIPVYNVAEYVEKSLLSAINQTYSQLEIIIVDDCGTDNSMALIGQLLENNLRAEIVKIISHSKNRGLSAARNTGIEHAQGEYLFFLDSDDTMSTDCIERMATIAQYEKVQCVIGKYDSSEKSKSYTPQLLLKQGIFRSGAFIREAYLNRKIYMMAWNKLINKQFIIEHGLFFKEGLIHEDELWSFQVFSIMESLAVIDEKTYIYQIRQSSIMTSVSAKNYDHWITILAEMTNWITKRPYLKADFSVFKFFEDQKNMLLRRMIREKKLLSDQQFLFYQKLRSIHYTNPVCYLFRNLTFRQRKRLLHYLTGSKLGFIIHSFLMK